MRKSDPKSAKNQPFFPVSVIFLSSPSLSTVAFGHHHPYHRRFITVSTTSGSLNSSPAAKQTPPVPLSLFLSLLQIFFSFFLPACHLQAVPTTSLTTARRPPWSDHHRARQLSPLPFLLLLFLHVVHNVNSRREL